MQIPTPTPVSNTQILQAVASTIDSAFEQGLVGVLLLFAASLFILTIAIVIIAWSRRNLKPADTTAGTNAAISALAEAISAGNKRFDDVIEAQKEKDNADRIQSREMDEKYIESFGANAAATNSLVDLLRKQGNENLAMKDALQTMTTQGSKPLNDLILKFDEIQRDVKSIRETSTNDHQSFERILMDIAEMKAIVLRIEAKRGTGESQIVPPVKP
jgi:hypothetical protein